MTFDQWYEVYQSQDGKCDETNIHMTHTRDKNDPSFLPDVKMTKFPKNVSPDQIIAGKGYVKGNLRFLCAAVNRMKHEFPIDIFHEYVAKIWSHNNLNKD